MSNLLDTLRQQTSKKHMALHEHPLLKACQMQKMDTAGYIRLLTAFYSPWKLVLPNLSSVPIEPLRSKLELRGKAIQKDLLELGISTEHSTETKVSEGKLLGICYVVIGSSMGAAMLSTSIRNSIGDVPVSYLSMTPKQAGWPELSSSLRLLHKDDYPEAGIGALETFAQIDYQLSISS